MEAHSHAGEHGHDHSSFSADIYNNQKAFKAVQLGTLGLGLTAIFQLVIVYFVDSAGLLADSLHNLGDVFTTVVLWIAYSIALRRPNRRYTYGYNRAEDIAGVIIIVVILVTAGITVWESYDKFVHNTPPTNLVLGMVGAVVGAIGNEVVAWYKIKIGKEINSVPLIADGQHSQMDGLTSLAALAGLIGVALGFPLADPIAGFVISIVIAFLVFDVVKQVSGRLMDSIDPALVERLESEAKEVPGVIAIQDMRARWFGRTLQVAMNVEVAPELSLVAGHAIAEEVRHRLLHQSGVSNVDIHVDPYDPEGLYHGETSHHVTGSTSGHDHDEHEHGHDEHDDHDHEHHDHDEHDDHEHDDHAEEHSHSGEHSHKH